jgi:hypothetical protein
MSSTIGTSSIRSAASRWRCSISSIAISCFPADPTLAFEALLAKESERRACLWSRRAARMSAVVRRTGAAIEAALEAGRLPDLVALREHFRPETATVPDVVVELVPLALYDELAAVRQVGADGGVA